VTRSSGRASKESAQDVRIEWAVRLAEVVLTDGQDEDKPFLLRWLSKVPDPRVRELLHRVVAGTVGTAFDPAKVYGQEPRLQVGALLSLARRFLEQEGSATTGGATAAKQAGT
jgi:hypothetical protein